MQYQTFPTQILQNSLSFSLIFFRSGLFLPKLHPLDFMSSLNYQDP